MKRQFGLAIALVALIGSGAALAIDPAAAIKERQDFYKDLGKNAKGLGEELKKPDASIADIQKFAAAIDAAAPKIPMLFPAGTGPEAGIKTAAKAEIWQKGDVFKADADKLVAAAHALDAAAKSGDLAAVKAAVPALGGACKGCHEEFRTQEH
jgi:cytochrome c556